MNAPSSFPTLRFGEVFKTKPAGKDSLRFDYGSKEYFATDNDADLLRNALRKASKDAANYSRRIKSGELQGDLWEPGKPMPESDEAILTQLYISGDIPKFVVSQARLIALKAKLAATIDKPAGPVLNIDYRHYDEE